VLVGAEARLRVAIRHPMDTGLVGNTPLYHVDELSVWRGETRLGSMKLWAAVAEDPAVGLIVPAAAGDTLTIRGRDTNGREIEGRIAVQAAP
jgi:sulfur-oxidizing protein SoxY